MSNESTTKIDRITSLVISILSFISAALCIYIMFDILSTPVSYGVSTEKAMYIIVFTIGGAMCLAVFIASLLARRSK